MSFNYLVFAAAITLVQLSSRPGLAQSDRIYILEGIITGLPNNTTMALVNVNRDTLSTTTSIEDHFTFQGKVNGADYYFILFDTLVTKKPSNALWLENNKMKVEGTISNVRQLRLSGSRSHRIYEAVMNLTDSAIHFGAAKGLYEFANAYKDSYFAPYIIYSMSNFLPSNAKKDFYDSLSVDVKGSTWGTKLKQSILADSISAFLKVGNKLADFQVTHISGKTTYMSEIFSKNNLTLIDFWASWCSPCRSAIPKLKAAYMKYVNAGFQIVGVSLDKKTEAWKKAVSEDGTTWEHYIENIDNPVSDNLAIVAIPAYILVNKEGIVLAKYITTANASLNEQNNVRLNTHLENVITQYLNVNTVNQ